MSMSSQRDLESAIYADRSTASTCVRMSRTWISPDMGRIEALLLLHAADFVDTSRGLIEGCRGPVGATGVQETSLASIIHF